MDVIFKILVTYEYEGMAWKWCVHTDHEAVLYEGCDVVPHPDDKRRWGTAYTKWGARRQVERCIRRIRKGQIPGYREQVVLAIRGEEDEI